MKCMEAILQSIAIVGFCAGVIWFFQLVRAERKAEKEKPLYRDPD